MADITYSPFVQDSVHVSGGFLTCKRCVDIVLSVFFLMLAAPLIAIIAVLIVLDSHGPIIFRQQRVSVRPAQNGEPAQLYNFTIYKFRTMYHNVSSERHEQFVKAFIKNDTDTINALQDSDATQSSRYKILHDPRVTRIGAILRKTSMDELPQFINILKGDMSLIGPRPALPYEVAMYEDWHCKRLQVKPGLTGLWQVMARSSVCFDDMVQLDIQYIERCCPWLEIKILLLTPLAILSGKGAK